MSDVASEELELFDKSIIFVIQCPQKLCLHYNQACS